MQETQSAGLDSQHPPRIGIPFRRASEEQAGNREKIEPYARAVELAGGEPRLISLFLSKVELERQARELDAIVLPGSPADVDPARYGETPRPETAAADEKREQATLSLMLRTSSDSSLPSITAPAASSGLPESSCENDP